MDVDDDLELVGTTAMAFHCNNSIKVIVDSRISNEGTPENERTSGWKVKVRNNGRKWFSISTQILAVMIGQKNPCIALRAVVEKWTKRMQAKGEEILVEDVAKFLENYFEKLKNGKTAYKFGLIISGHDSTKGLQVYRISIVDDDVNNEEVDMYTIFGTGSASANHVMAPEYELDLSDGAAKNLARRTIFNSSFYNKSTDGNLYYFDVTKYGWSETRVDALQTYLSFYSLYDERRIIFLVYPGNEIFSADDLVAVFRPCLDIITAHLVDRRLTPANKLFNFHRLMFASEEDAEKALNKGSCLNDKLKASTILSRFGYQLSYKGNTLFMQKASTALLLHMRSHSKILGG